MKQRVTMMKTANVDSEDCKYGDECGMFSTLEGWHLAVGAGRPSFNTGAILNSRSEWY